LKSLRFIGEARQEFLSEVAYYNAVEPGLGERFATAVDKPLLGLSPFPRRAHLQFQIHGAFLPRDSHFSLSIDRNKKKSLFLLLPTMPKGLATGALDYMPANIITKENHP
jgi:hypothetical protein